MSNIYKIISCTLFGSCSTHLLIPRFAIWPARLHFNFIIRSPPNLKFGIRSTNLMQNLDTLHSPLCNSRSVHSLLCERLCLSTVSHNVQETLVENLQISNLTTIKRLQNIIHLTKRSSSQFHKFLWLYSIITIHFIVNIRVLGNVVGNNYLRTKSVNLKIPEGRSRDRSGGVKPNHASYWAPACNAERQAGPAGFR